MNTRYNMIIIKGEIKTPDIISCMYNSYTKKTDVKFNNGKILWFCYAVCNTIVILCVLPVKGGEMEMRMIISISASEHLRQKKEEERTVIFLDIDGVLQPCLSQKRFDHDLSETREMVARETGNSKYLQLDKYDVGAVYYDWSEKAVYNLKKLITNCDAEIVISSDWKRTRTLEELKLLFRLHGLDEYITDMTSYTDSSFKNQEIRLYLDEHPKLHSYVVIDDVDMEKDFRGHTVYTAQESYLSDEYAKYAERILKYGAWWEDEYAGLIKHEQLVEHEIKKVIFLDIDGVLNDEGLRYDEGHIIDNQFVLNLRRIMDKTSAEIVLTSSWRYSVRRYLHDNVENSSVKILFDFFDRYKMKIVGCTLEYNISGPYSRPFEIRSWLQKRPEVKNFVILDDDKWNWNWMESFVVCTEDIKGKGLHGKFVQKAIDIINGKISG